MIYAKAENWPVLCYYDRIKCVKFQVFLKLSTWAFQPAKNYPKNDIFGPRIHFGALYLIIVPQIQVKLVSTQTYLGKLLLQSIIAPLDFDLSSYSPLKMSKKK